MSDEKIMNLVGELIDQFPEELYEDNSFYFLVVYSFTLIDELTNSFLQRESSLVLNYKNEEAEGKEQMNILIIEDDPAICQELKQLLENALYEVTTLTEFQRPVEEVIRIQPDLVLLDVNLPEESGFSVCQKLREVSDVPVIFVTSRTDSMDELNGMLRGGDDYITKPFNSAVLLAHIAAVLKRTRKESIDEAKLVYKGVELDTVCGYIRYQGNQLDLTKNELKILHYLFRHKNEIVPRIELVEYLWDQKSFIDDNALSVNVTRLRSKLEEIGIHDFIETKRGMGYRI